MAAALKIVHVSTVVLSISFFVVRLFWVYTRPAYLENRWVRVLPHVNDTLLLVSAIGLTMVLQQYPFVDAWLTAKVVALVIYIVSGSFALKRARSRVSPMVASVASLSCIVYIVAVALTHRPFPLL